MEMNKTGKAMEIEAKIPVRSLDALYERLLREADQVILNRAFERNFRFDDEKGRLAANREVLRLRSCGGKTVLTWKGTGNNSNENLAVREEIETVLSDEAAGFEILTRLGYRVIFQYEKYRGEFRWEGVSLMLDETPMGCFVEIEGENERQIQEAAAKLNLDYAESTSMSYQRLWLQWCEADPGAAPNAMVFSKSDKPL